jgi:ABC-2 type transport system permease protein
MSDTLATPATTAAVTARPRTAPMKPLRDTWLIYQRSLMLTLRNPIWVFVGLTQPIAFLLLFGPLLKGLAVAGGGSGDDAYNLFVPGLLVQLALFGTMFVGFGLIAELRAGVVERMRVTPISRGSMLLGRTLRDITVLVVQAFLLIVLSIPFGLTIDPASLVVVLVLVALIGLALAPISYALGLMLKTEDALAPLLNFVSLPLLLLSGILLPMALAPDWLQTVASLNPLSHAVDAARALFNGQFSDPVVVTGVALMGTLSVLSVWVGSRAFGRAVS